MPLILPTSSEFKKRFTKIFLFGIIFLISSFFVIFLIEKVEKIKKEKTTQPFIEIKKEEKANLVEIQNPSTKLIEEMSRLPFEYYSLFGERNKVFVLKNLEQECPRFVEGLILIPSAIFPGETLLFIFWIEDCDFPKIAQITGKMSNSTLEQEIEVVRTFPKGRNVYQWEGHWRVPFNALPGEYFLNIELKSVDGEVKKLNTKVEVLSLPIFTPK